MTARQKEYIHWCFWFGSFFLEGDYFSLQIVYSVSRNMIFKYTYKKKKSVSNLCLHLSW